MPLHANCLLRDNLHEVSDPIFPGKNKKNINNLSSSESAQSVLGVNSAEDTLKYFSYFLFSYFFPENRVCHFKQCDFFSLCVCVSEMGVCVCVWGGGGGGGSRGKEGGEKKNTSM